VRLQPLGHLSGVNRMEGTTLDGSFLRGRKSLHDSSAVSCFSILWVKSSKPQLEGEGAAQRLGDYEGSFPAESGPAGDTEPGAEDAPEADMPAAAALAALPFPLALLFPFPLEAAEGGSGGTFVLSTT
jgi:hypothetical protein